MVQLLLLLKGVALLREGRLWKARKLLLSREAALKGGNHTQQLPKLGHRPFHKSKHSNQYLFHNLIARRYSPLNWGNLETHCLHLGCESPRRLCLTTGGSLACLVSASGGGGRCIMPFQRARSSPLSARSCWHCSCSCLSRARVCSYACL